MASASELGKLVGMGGELVLEGFTVPIFVLDARCNFGRTEVQVTPQLGTGSMWVSMHRVVNLAAKEEHDAAA